MIASTELLSTGEEHFPAEKNKQRNVLAKSNVSVDELLYQNPYDIFDSMNIDNNLKAAIAYAAVANCTDDDKGFITDDVLKEVIEENKDAYVHELSRLFEKSFNHMDLENLLIRSIVENMGAVDHKNIEPEEERTILDRLDRIMQLSSKILQKGVTKNLEVVKQFSKLKDIYKRRIFEGKYFTKSNINGLKSDIISGKINLQQLNGSIIELLEDIPTSVFFTNTQNLIFGIRKGHINQKNLYDSMLQSESVDTEVLVYALNSDMLTTNEIISLYIKKVISIEQVRFVEETMQKQLISLDEVIQKYKDEYEEVYGDNNPRQKGIESFEEYASKVISLQEPGFESEKVEEALIEMDSENIETAMIIFYQNYLIDAEKVLESCGSGVIQFFRPVDIRNLYQAKKINIQELENTVRTMDNERAIHFICQVFPDKENVPELNRLIQTLTVEEEETSRNLGGHRNKQIICEEREKGNIGINAIAAKYRFYESLDEDYSVKFSKNGYGIFTMPNIKYKGTEEPSVIIEPIIDKSHSTAKVKAAQDKAMWIVSLSLWNKEKTNLMGRGQILRTDVLRDLYDLLKKQDMTKMHHVISSEENIDKKQALIKEGKTPKTGWPFKVFDFLKSGKNYPKEKTDEIMQISLELEKSMVRN